MNGLMGEIFCVEFQHKVSYPFIEDVYFIQRKQSKAHKLKNSIMFSNTPQAFYFNLTQYYLASHIWFHHYLLFQHLPKSTYLPNDYNITFTPDLLLASSHVYHKMTIYLTSCQT